MKFSTNFTQKIPLTIIIISTLLSVLSCKKEHTKVYDVPDVIQPYIDEFISQGNQRGTEIIIDDLIIELKSNLVLEGDEKAGLCTYGSNSRTPLIELDTTSFNWTMNDYTREQLIFHELGHCILDQRGHRNSRLDNGNYGSYMRADGTPIYGRLSLFKKEFYLDEIFDNDAPQPDWATSNFTYNSVQTFQKQTLLSDEFNDNSGSWNISSSGNVINTISNGFYSLKNQTESPQIQFFTVPNLIANDNFEIEISYEIPESFENYCLLLWGLQINNFGEVENSYYYGYSNDTFLDIGEFTTQSFYNEARTEVQPYQSNKLTIRRIDDFYYIYINEIIFDVLSYEQLPSKNIAFYISPQTEMKVDYLSISKLNL